MAIQQGSIELHVHQVTAVDWLLSLTSKSVTGAILADEMGLGKTIMALAYLSRLHRDGLARPPFLIVVIVPPHHSRSEQQFAPLGSLVGALSH